MVNNAFANKRHNHLGKFYDTIDFSLNEYDKTHLQGQKSSPIGNLHLGNAKFPLTLSEINHLIETLEDTRSSFVKKIRMGI